jgi:hypothetical protein
MQPEILMEIAAFSVINFRNCVSKYRAIQNLLLAVLAGYVRQNSGGSPKL